MASPDSWTDDDEQQQQQHQHPNRTRKSDWDEESRRILRVYDDKTVFYRWTVGNRLLSCYLALCQLVVCLVSLAQHGYSLARYDNIFYCRFNRQAYSDVNSRFLSYDVIIFDFGLFHEILGVQECMANYVDGGYVRCVWCVGHSMVIAVLAVVACPARRVPNPKLLWPVLSMQSIYCIGLIIFTAATTDKLLIYAVTRDLTFRFVYLAAAYWLGTASNCFLGYVLFHYYWHVEKVYYRAPVHHV